MNKLIISVISLVMILSLSVAVSATEEAPDFISVDDAFPMEGDYPDSQAEDPDGIALSATKSGMDATISYERVAIKSRGQIVDTFIGVPAYYAPMTSGSPYQCSELITRYKNKMKQMHGSALRGWEKSSTPKAGDYIYATAAQRGKSYGHWAIVKEVNGNTLTLIEQNWTWHDGSNYIAAKNRKIPYGGSYTNTFTIYTPSGVNFGSGDDGSAPPQQQKFSDVSTSHWAYNAINSLTSKGVINGYDNGTFKPSNSITRAEFATILALSAKSNGANVDAYTTQRFSDVKSSFWAYENINWAQQNGVVSGYENGTFNPNATITRQELAQMLLAYRENYLKRSLPGNESKQTFSDDYKIGGWAKNAVYKLQQAGVISDGGSFKPLDRGTRAESVVMLCNLLDL